MTEDTVIETIRSEMYQIYQTSINLQDPELFRKSEQFEKVLSKYYKDQFEKKPSTPILHNKS
jgi:hypothetical protein